jgi:signal transduction histidine kinase
MHNAVKSVAANGGGRVRVKAERRGSGVALEVSDDGIGFAPEESRQLFDKFYRPGSEMRPRFKGTGLGLYLVRRLMELGGGRVCGESPGAGSGATFRAIWPVAAEGVSS